MSKNSVADKNRRTAGKQLSFNFSVKDERLPKLIGLLCMLVSLYLLIAFTSHLFTWREDQPGAKWSMLFNDQYEMTNWLGRLGAIVSNQILTEGFGVSSYLIIPALLFTGIYLFKGLNLVLLFPLYRKLFIYSICFSVIFAFIFQKSGFEWGGSFGKFIFLGLDSFVGTAGIIVILLFSILGILIWTRNPDFKDWTKEKIIEALHPKSMLESAKSFIKDWAAFNPSKQPTAAETAETSKVNNGKKTKSADANENNIENIEKPDNNENAENKSDDNVVKPLRPRNKENQNKDFVIIYPKDEEEQENQDKQEENKQLQLELKNPLTNDSDDSNEEDDSLEKEEGNRDISLTISDGDPDAFDNLKITEENEDHFEPYDPTLELPRYQNPPLDLLETYQNEKPMVDEAELEAKKDQIIETLMNYKIEIVDIKATVGPTVTLYEIIPAPGVRISKIKNLEDDIALSLAALGIRIIAPIPGKGTIGIEVPNKNKQIVSLREVLASPKFSNAKMDLPIVLGKTISNEVFVADLAKMPHLLIAGATGQGKSVGINTVIMSLLYKKHPSQIKLILIDPKKVELSPYNEIASHYLAFLPDEEEAIVTETSKVIQTLYSLTLEMDNRYNLLKKAGVRHITEYNEKFVSRKLNPEKGHYFMPYMVLIVDEFADLIMTAGKEVEIPIGRLAQLARAVGIHLIIATQRPSVNIITGVIKANFPARLAFKVATKIDSRTILDAGGAEQLIGRGDMLLSSNGSLLRIQCAFVDTPEVHRIIEHIANQPGYPVPYYLPSYGDDEGGDIGGSTGDKLNQVLQDMDEFFEDAARLVVINQSGSTSMIQRRLKLGYNRAGRIMDQLEYAGIVGANEGSKARQVLFQDEIELEDYLKILRDKKSKMTYK